MLHSVVGGVYLFYYKVIKSEDDGGIIWSDFNLNDGVVLKIGLVLLFMQVGKRKKLTNKKFETVRGEQ